MYTLFDATNTLMVFFEDEFISMLSCSETETDSSSGLYLVLNKTRLLGLQSAIV